MSYARPDWDTKTAVSPHSWVWGPGLPLEREGQSFAQCPEPPQRKQGPPPGCGVADAGAPDAVFRVRESLLAYSS